MSAFIEVFAILLTLFPSWLAVAIMGFVTLLVIVIVIKVVAFILDALPFV